MEMQISFPGKSRVDATYKGHIIRTDQPQRNGGDDSAPAPFDHFLASIGTCAGFYVSSFLAERGVPLDGLTMTLATEKDPQTRRVTRIRLDVGLPEGFPAKYERAIARAVDQCSVKQHLLHPPEIATRIRVAAGAR